MRFITLLTFLLYYTLALHAAPRYYEASETHTSLREVRDSLEDLKHECRNHETEIRIFQEKLNNQETTVDSLRQQVQEATLANKELVRTSTNAHESKLESIDLLTKGVTADIKALKAHANDASSVLEAYQQRIAKLEKIIEVQNKNISNLEKALTALASVLEVKESLSCEKSSEGVKLYEVKSGDSLEKIARHQGTTIKALKELNQMTSDRIIVGQKLKIPNL